MSATPTAASAAGCVRARRIVHDALRAAVVEVNSSANPAIVSPLEIDLPGPTTSSVAQCGPAVSSTMAPHGSATRKLLWYENPGFSWLHGPPWPWRPSSSTITPTASCAVAARSSASRNRSIPSSAGSPSGWFVNTASLPITTPCSLAPISAPHIHHGCETSTALVWATCGTEIHVQSTSSTSGSWSAAGYQRGICASFGSRSLFFANSTPSGVNETRVSHTPAKLVGPAPCDGSAVCYDGQS